MQSLPCQVRRGQGPGSLLLLGLEEGGSCQGPRAQWAEGGELGHGSQLPCPPATLAAMMVPPQPQPQPLMPSVDARLLATQQQNFINQQALILVRVGKASGLPSRGGSGAGSG